MLLKKITLQPFAGIVNKEVVLENGLNVLFGPNEAGKSTLVKAIYFALFEPTNLAIEASRRQFKMIGPVAGGDTVKVILNFEINHSDYRLIKCWGAVPSSSLTDSNGLVYSDPNLVSNMLQEFLGLNTATWKNILFAHQSLLTETVRTLVKNNELTDTFSDLLLSGALVQGGISSNALENELEKKITEYFNNWNKERNLPAGNRGIDNPYVKNVGHILKAYYSLKTTEIELADCINYENKLDQLSTDLEGITRDVLQLEEFISANNKVYNDISIRKTLDAQYVSRKKLADELKAKALSWPVNDLALNNAKEKINRLTQELKDIASELETAIKKESAVQKNALLISLTQKKNNLEAAQNKLNNFKKVEQQYIDAEKKYNKSKTDNTIKLDAQQLRMHLIAHQKFSIKYTMGLEIPQEMALYPGHEIKETASGKFQLETDQFSLEIISGQDDINTIIEKLNLADVELEKIYKKYDVSNSSEFNELISSFNTAEGNVQKARTEFDSLLGDFSYDLLENEINEINNLPAVRSSNYLTQIQLAKNGEKVAAETEEKQINGIVQSLVNEFGTQEILLDKQIEAISDLNEVTNQRNNLAPLPEGIISGDEFVTQYDNKVRQLEDKKKNKTHFEKQIIIHENDEPSKSVNELNEEKEHKKSVFERMLAEGKAYQMIHEKLLNIINADASNVYDNYHQTLSTYFKKITSEKYNSVKAEGVVPEAVSNDSITLTQDFLSEGTQDALALAIRLSMAEHYLNSRNGFLVMDDPLTEMDKERRKNAADCIRNFAEQKQVLVFTCHEAHAEILSGNQISLT